MTTKNARARKAPSESRSDAKPAANVEESAPDLIRIYCAVMDECSALLVLLNAFSDFGQITIGHTITEDDADCLAAIYGQLHMCRKRLADLSRITDDASVNYKLVPNAYERARLRLVAADAEHPEVVR